MNYRREKTIITIESYRRTIIHLRRGGKVAWCDLCAAETTIISPNEAAALLQTTVRQIFRKVETGEIHFRETKTGEMLICRNSCRKALHAGGLSK